MANIAEKIHGKVADVAPFIPTDPLEMLKRLMSGEIKEWPQIQELGNLYQTYMLDSLSNAIPGFRDILKTGGEATQAVLQNAKDLSESKIPQDLQDAVLRKSAFTSLGAGTLGGPMGLALGARDLGLTGLQLMTQGAQLGESGVNAAQRWAGISTGTIMPPPLYSPEWFSTFMAQQNAAKQATKQMKLNQAAQPDKTWSGIVGTAINLIGAYLGAGRGGGQSFVGGGGEVPMGDTAGPGDYNAATNTGRVSQYPGAIGSVSNWLGGGGNFAGKGLPGAFGIGTNNSIYTSYGGGADPYSNYPVTLPFYTPPNTGYPTGQQEPVYFNPPTENSGDVRNY